MMRAVIFALLLVCFSVSSPLQAQPLKDVLVQFTFKVRGDYGFLFLADARRYFRDEGISVTFREGQGAGTVLAAIANDTGNTIGVAVLNQVAAAISKKLPVISVATWQVPSPGALVARPGVTLKQPKDLIGKKVALMQGQNASIMFSQFLAANNIKESDLTVQTMDPSATRTAFLRGDVDVKDEFITDGIPVLEHRMNKPLDRILFSDWGFKDLGLGAVVSTSFAEKNPELIKAFLRAAARGIKDMIADPVAAAKVTKAAFSASLSDESVVLEQVRQANKLTPQQVDGHVLGWIDDQKWKDQIDVLERLKVITDRLPLEKYYTNRFVE